MHGRTRARIRNLEFMYATAHTHVCNCTYALTEKAARNASACRCVRVGDFVASFVNNVAEEILDQLGEGVGVPDERPAHV